MSLKANPCAHIVSLILMHLSFVSLLGEVCVCVRGASECASRRPKNPFTGLTFDRIYTYISIQLTSQRRLLHAKLFLTLSTNLNFPLKFTNSQSLPSNLIIYLHYYYYHPSAKKFAVFENVRRTVDQLDWLNGFRFSHTKSHPRPYH